MDSGCWSRLQKPVFIALNPARPNLAFPGVDVTKDSPDHDLSTGNESESSGSNGDDLADDEGGARNVDGEGERTSGTADSDEPKYGSENDMSRSPSPIFCDQEYNDPEDLKFPLDKDEVDIHAHAVKGHRRYLALESIPICPHRSGLGDEEYIETGLGESTEMDELTPAGHLQIRDVFFTRVSRYIVEPLESFTELAVHITRVSEDVKSQANLHREVEQLFGVGPGGISIILPILSFLYKGLHRLRSHGYVINSTSRKKKFRLEETPQFFATGTSSLKGSHTISICFRLWSPDSFDDAFGSATDPGNINHCVVGWASTDSSDFTW
ncbi:hypothetical protein C8J57DRAFT_1237697 [Mycena rebaudengoi]|nr:hypothetical protein C8J57DRAFT_1237697 [Mycena rebaudengoi]